MKTIGAEPGSASKITPFSKPKKIGSLPNFKIKPKLVKREIISERSSDGFDSTRV